MIDLNKFTKTDRVITVVFVFWTIFAFLGAIVEDDIISFFVFAGVGAVLAVVLAVGIKWISAAGK